MYLAKRIFVFVKKLPRGLQTMLSITHAAVSSSMSFSLTHGAGQEIHAAAEQLDADILL